MQVTFRFGPTNELSKNLREGTTVQQALSDSSLKAGLGFGDNVQAIIDDTVQSGSTTLNDGDIVTIETRANSKA